MYSLRMPKSGSSPQLQRAADRTPERRLDDAPQRECSEIGPSPVSVCRPSLENFVTSEDFGDSYNLVTKETRTRYFGNQ